MKKMNMESDRSKCVESDQSKCVESDQSKCVESDQSKCVESDQSKCGESDQSKCGESDQSKCAASSEQPLSSAQLARIERQRLRARALRDARLAVRPATASAAPDTGGGFLPEERGAEARRASPPGAPELEAAARWRCAECARPFAHSYLWDAFGHRVCDGCRDDGEAHALLPRSEARALYLLKDCDLDAREPPLRCVRRRNPHGARLHDVRLYLRPQLEERALLVWGSEEALERERARREGARVRSRHRQTERRLRALRCDVRSSLFARARPAHAHQYGAEQYDAAADQWTRACPCGHTLAYEKM